jgi:hydrogenase nickel incorporation protein HypA/HybF
MHELSIAYSLVELASESAKEAGATKVCAVHLRLGVLSGVVRGALEFSYEIAAADTPLAGSVLVVTELPVRVYCASCEEEVELASVQRFRCPKCDTPSGDIRQGRELEIELIEIDVGETAVSAAEEASNQTATADTAKAKAETA